MNLAIVIGNLGADPECRDVGTDNKVANFSVATKDKWKDREGNMQEKTEWHRIVAWGRQAEIAEKYLRKGSKVSVQGSMYTDEWEKDGVKRYTTKIKCFRFEMLTPKSSNPAGPAQDKAPPPTDDDDVPF